MRKWRTCKLSRLLNLTLELPFDETDVELIVTVSWALNMDGVTLTYIDKERVRKETFYEDNQ
jgi:hypothetical protein